MDIILQTNDPREYLAILGVERFSDNSGFCGILVVRSGVFTGQSQFCVEPEPLADFISALEGMDSTLSGKAALKPIYEESYIELELNKTGRVTVSGLVLSGDYSHRLGFQFGTDQTCLAPLARDLRQCQSMAAT